MVAIRRADATDAVPAPFENGSNEVRTPRPPPSILTEREPTLCRAPSRLLHAPTLKLGPLASMGRA